MSDTPCRDQACWCHHPPAFTEHPVGPILDSLGITVTWPDSGETHQVIDAVVMFRYKSLHNGRLIYQMVTPVTPERRDLIERLWRAGKHTWRRPKAKP